ncbi:MAG: hypothetical protein CL569_07725 [Alphaproteobacteria bacterium]|nr:hypothetical protein [Alphaproteobacteria bacterium]|tara:strand:+ start:3301 stop:3645 length:345 start_codon:yes stop_codon:yes gene_type:complete
MEDASGVRELLTDIIIQGIEDYEACKAEGLIKNGRPRDCAICKCAKPPRNLNHDEVHGVCDFIWGGWMARLIDLAGIRINTTAIYKRLEPRLWESLIYQHRKASATSRLSDFND